MAVIPGASNSESNRKAEIAFSISLAIRQTLHEVYPRVPVTIGERVVQQEAATFRSTATAKKMQPQAHGEHLLQEVPI